MSGEAVLEGFLCPLCMKDLGDVVQLQVHFEETHSKEDQAFVQSLKDFFGKAKKKILNDEIENLDDLSVQKIKLKPKYENIDPVSGIRTDVHHFPGSANHYTSHFAQFKKMRSVVVDRLATETNRLIVRLDRLLEGMPQDASKRREHEQSVVQWVQEQLVKLCPGCAKSFNISRRKHHCRLCGSVMCGDCSRFIDWNFCRKLINPSTISVYRPPEERLGWSVNGKYDSRSVGTPTRSNLLGLPKLRRSSSKESVNSSMMSLMEPRNAEEFRVCDYCLNLLLRREAAIEQQTAKPIIAQFYEKLREYTLEGSELSVKYLEMAESLHNGETSYHLADAKSLRLKLLKIAENVDLMSKKISALGMDQSGEIVTQSRGHILQTQIRRASVNFIKDTLVGLPSLPSEEQLVVLQERRRVEIAKKVEEERKKAQEARAKYKALQERRNVNVKTPSSGKTSSSSRSDQPVKYEKGFVLSNRHLDGSRTVTDDPMVEQINIIKGFIQKAREANRFDEVSMLEANMKELQAEYKKMKEEEREKKREEQNLEYESFPSPDMASQPSSNGSTKTLTPSASTNNASRSTHLPQLPSSGAANGMVTCVGGSNGNSKLMEGVANLNPFKTISSLNPFGGDDSEDEYDASGKNPFAE